MQLKSFCLAVLLGREGGEEQRAHESGSATAALPDVFIRTLLALPVYILGHTKATKRDMARQWAREVRKKSAKLLVRKQTRAFILENGEFGGKGTTCANSHCISKHRIHSLHGNQVKKGRTPEQEPLDLDPTDSRKSCSSEIPL